jgi:1-phosphofructokinase family hexose kinase
MILTVTLNPLLERRLIFPSVKLGNDFRTDKDFFTAGGKGINVSRQLYHLDTKNMAYTFLGGNNGKIMKNLLTEEQINFTFVQTKNETRQADLVIEENENRITTFFGSNSFITMKEAEEFKLKLKKMIENCEIVVFSGSSPCQETDDIFPFGIETANEYDKISICDTYGNHFQNCINKSPTIIHNNLHEIEKSVGLKLTNEKEILDYLHQLYIKGIKQVYLTDGGNPVYAGNFDFVYKANCPKIKEADPTGSGDAFVAGLAFGLHNSLTFEETFRTAISLGAANASRWEMCKVKLEDIVLLKDEIKIETVGKRINPI